MSKMNSVALQRDLVGTMKKEIHLNLEILNRVQPMSSATKEVLKENAMDKLNKISFHNLSQYLVSIVDPQFGANLPWPVYDTAVERNYRNKLASFINDYSTRGLLSPVMSSYLVNPSCYKVTMFILELSQLALQKVLQSKMKEHQRKSYNDITNKYKSENKDDLITDIENETNRICKKVSYYLNKRQALEKIAGMLRNQIKSMEDTLDKVKAQKYINNIVDGFIDTHTVDEDTKAEVFKLKQVDEPSKILDCWLQEVDNQITHLETTWDEKVTPLLEVSKVTQRNTELLIARHIGQADRSTYMVEYNHKSDYICTKDLQDEVNSQQKYILMNIVRDERLNFPNLIRGFLIAISYIMKGADTGNIFRFNEAMEDGQRRYKELVADMKIVLERVARIDAKMEPSPPVTFQQLEQMSQFFDIPPLPDLSDLKIREQYNGYFDTFTPLNTSKRRNVQFNLRRPNSSFCAFPKPPNPGHYRQSIKDDFLKTLMSSSAFSHPITHNPHNMSVMSQVSKVNETVCGASSGFTKDQIQRLLSSRKTSATKKKNSTERSSVSVKKAFLFNESGSNESRSLYRSISSPNLVENKGVRKRLSVVHDDSLPCLELSGITALDNEISYGTPESVQTEGSRNPNAANLPITVTPELENRQYEDFKVDLDKNFNESEVETPKMQTIRTVQKTNSLEKIINRYKLVRANIVADRNEAIVEENLNISTVNLGISPSDKASLPDLVSPGYGGHTKKPTDIKDDIFDLEDRLARIPRASLGTMLGVDQTFLDQFDLID